MTRILGVWLDSQKPVLLVGIVVFAVLLGTAYLVKAAPLIQSVDEGRAIFEGQCLSCHTIGGGDLVGPDLLGIVAQRDRDWLTRWIADPDQMLAERDPIATSLLEDYNGVPMPDMGLSEGEVAAVIAYLEAESGQGAEPGAKSPPAAVTLGDPEVGRKLFVGEYVLINDGPACLSCHNVNGVGALGGGTLGPDLTHVYTRYGEAGLASALQALPCPTMLAIFQDAPLTDEEVGALLAFFKQVDERPTPPVRSEIDRFFWIGLVGSAGLVVLGHLTWKNRFSGARKPLLGEKK
jgi:mono/diheme cytochrome c family protein